MSSNREIFIEVIAAGPIVKVCAVDPLTGDEVSFQGPASTPRAQLEKLAVNKLRYAQQKKHKPDEKPSSGGDTSILV